MLEGQETSGSKADGRFVPIFVSSTMSIDWEQAQGDKRPLILSLPIGAYRQYHGDSGRPSPNIHCPSCDLQQIESIKLATRQILL